MNRGISEYFVRIVLVIFTLMLIFPTMAIMAASSGNSSSAPVTLQWSLDALLVVPDSEVAEQGVRAATGSRIDSLVKKLNGNGIKAQARCTGRDSGGISYSLAASGESDLETFREILYTTAKPEFNLLGGVTEMEIEASAFNNQNLTLVMESNSSTGYRWRVVSDSAMSEHSPAQYQKHTLGYGVPERQIIHLTSAGTGPIKLVYGRLWMNSIATRHLKLKLPLLPATLDLSNPNAPAGPLTAPKGTVHIETFPPLSKQSMPASFDWRNNAGANIVTPIRDQGYCGSCWAFGTVGIMESALWKQGIANKDLSEQFLVSCNKDDWDCDSGGLTAHKYHYDTIGINQTTIGAVYETDKPYTATNGACMANYYKPYALSGWAFITGSEWTVPTDDQIKSAIYTYGPITAGVCAGSGWDAYASGVFSTDETSQCGGSTNHQIILVGWNDPGQYWILRNSWGAGWGIDGYMHIKYGVSRVGEGASWVTAISDSTSVVYANFTGYGLYKWNGAAWSRINTAIPSGMTASRTALYASYTGNGVYQYNGTAWSKINTLVPTLMAASYTDLYASFTGNGLYKWNGAAWSKINTLVPTIIAASGTELYASFTGYGIYKYNGTAWNKINTTIPSGMTTSGTELYASFTGNGVYKYNGTVWSRVNTLVPTIMAASSTDLYANFTENGLYKYNGTTWSRIITTSPASMVSSR